MRRPLFLLAFLLTLVLPGFAQRSVKPTRTVSKLYRGVVIDGSLALARTLPGYSSPIVRRLRRGREVQINATRITDGVLFVRVLITKRLSGWIQREALAIRGSADDERRLLLLTASLNGFDQIESAKLFLTEFPASTARPQMLLLLGDAVEEAASAVSRSARRKMNKAAADAVGGSMIGYLLNFSGLDRYRRLGLTFAANPRTMRIHYTGDAWREIVSRYPATPEARSARQRLSELEIELNRQAD